MSIEDDLGWEYWGALGLWESKKKPLKSLQGFLKETPSQDLASAPQKFTYLSLGESEEKPKGKSDGGPSSYYDFPSGMCTLNDYLEFLSESWGKYSIHMKDITKACARWGNKIGTDHLYDAKKIVYSGLRLIIMIAGKQEARKYLISLLNDKQFKD